MSRGFVVAIVGAESTGKTTLAQGLAHTFDRPDRRAVQVGEYLREFCDREQRTPRRGEQAGIAAEQTLRIEAAAASHAIVIADTTALMTAVYSEWVFGDTSLHADAARAHRRCDLTLLTALDLAWTPDGLQRDGPQVREPIDARVRSALLRAGVAYAVVSGSGQARLQSALRAVEHAIARNTARNTARTTAPTTALPAGEPATPIEPGWAMVCERCGDPDCERRLLARPGSD